MINPEDFFCIIDNADAAQIECRTEDSYGRNLWLKMPDSFTPDDLSQIAAYFENQARALRDRNQMDKLATIVNAQKN